MFLAKMCWGVRALFYKPLLGKIGIPSYIGKPIYISNFKRLFLGTKVRIYPGMRSETVNKRSTIKIGNNVSIGQNFHVVSYNDSLKIGNNVTIAGNVFITNCDHDYKGKGSSVLDNALIEKKTEINDDCFIGNNVSILAGTILGHGCIVGANAVLRGSYPPFSVVVGIPGKVIKRYEKGQNND